MGNEPFEKRIMDFLNEVEEIGELYNLKIRTCKITKMGRYIYTCSVKVLDNEYFEIDI